MIFKPVMKLKRVAVVTAVIAFSVLFILTARYPVSADNSIYDNWTQFQHDEEKSGIGSYTAPVESPVLQWSAYTWNNASVGIETPAIIVDGTVYVHAGNGLWAFSAKTGAEIWSVEIPGSATLQTSTPAYAEGRIFIATNNGYIRAFDAETGENPWNSKISDVILQCPITVCDSYLYIGQGGVGGSENSYFCLDIDGNLIWEYSSETAGYLWNGASIIGQYIVFGNHEAVLTCLNRFSGEYIDCIELSEFASDAGRCRASATYCNGFLYTTSEYSLDTGYIWKAGFDDSTGFFDDEVMYNEIGFSTSTPVVYDGRIYVGEGEHGCSGSLICLDASNLDVVWSYPVDGGVKSSPVLSIQDDTAYVYFNVSMDDGHLFCLNGDGALVWEWDPPDESYILQGVSIFCDRVFLGTCSGYLYCLADGSDTADVNGDGTVDILDMDEISSCFGNTGDPGWIPQDVKNDGVIDVLDLIIVGNYCDE